MASELYGRRLAMQFISDNDDYVTYSLHNLNEDITAASTAAMAIANSFITGNQTFKNGKQPTKLVRLYVETTYRDELDIDE